MGTVIISEYAYLKSTEELEKEKEYMEYLKTHISNVQKAYKMYFIPLLKKDELVLKSISKEELFTAIEDAKENIENHDASKYEDIEFYPYRKHYYPTATEKSFGDEYAQESEQMYEEAWKHHYENNPHHQEYWLDKETGLPKDMEYRYIIEMICDWIAMGMYFQSDTLEWYKKEADEERTNMTAKTKLIVEELLMDIIFK